MKVASAVDDSEHRGGGDPGMEKALCYDASGGPLTQATMNRAKYILDSRIFWIPSHVVFWSCIFLAPNPILSPIWSEPVMAQTRGLLDVLRSGLRKSSQGKTILIPCKGGFPKRVLEVTAVCIMIR